LRGRENHRDQPPGFQEWDPQLRQSFRHTGGIFLTPLALFAVPTFEFFSDLIHWRAHGHGWVTE
jgi:hypothetical protein